MIDANDSVTADLIPAAKKRGRPSTGKAKSGAQRQRALTARKKQEIMESYGNEAEAKTESLIKRLDYFSKMVDKGTAESWQIHSLQSVLKELNNRYGNK